MTCSAPRRLLTVGLTLACLGACAHRSEPEPLPPTRSALVPPDQEAARALLALVAGDAARCVVVLPSRLERVRWPLAALASQSELPWKLAHAPQAYVRLEQRIGDPTRAQLELLRFASAPDREAIRAELERSLQLPLRWTSEDGERACTGEPTCRVAQAGWIDATTLRIQRGAWDEVPASRDIRPRCTDLLATRPEAIEAAVRAPWMAGSEQRETELALLARTDGLERWSARHYGEPESAERALRAILRGHEELPSLVGVPAQELGERNGDALVQRTFASFADLQLALDDRERSLLRSAPALTHVDATSREAVYAAFDATVSGVHDGEQLAQLDALLTRARVLHVTDEGLLRRHYRLALALRHDARAALSIANEARGHGNDAHGWQLRARASLARFDEPALARALREVHGLGDAAAVRMARELARKATRPSEDPALAHERAEWAYLAAARIAAKRHARGPASLRLAVTELPRWVATLAESAHPAAALGVHVLAFAPALDRMYEEGRLWEAAAGRATWSERTFGPGRAAALFAAHSSDDAQLIALGRELAATLEDGPFELAIELEGNARVTLALSGRRDGAWLLVDHGSRALRTLHADALERLLIAPLRTITGSAFPPDELVIEARDAAEAAAIEYAATRVQHARCTREGVVVRCRGTLADTGAARRALLAVAHELLADEARLLWSGTD